MTNFDSVVAANQQTAALLLCKEAFITAAADTRLQRTHIRVLAAIAMFIDVTTEAWPSRKTLSAVLGGLSLKTVSNTVTELRNFGYLVTTRKPVENAGGKTLTVYTFGNIDHDTIRMTYGNFISEYVYEYKKTYASPIAIMAGLQSKEETSSPREGNCRPRVPLGGGTAGQEFPSGGEITDLSISTQFPSGGELANRKFPSRGECSPPEGNHKKPTDNKARARALAATVAKNEDQDVGTLSSSLSCSTTVIVEGQTPALPVQLETGALQQQPAAVEPNASSSEATHLDLVASLRAIEDARTAEDTLYLSEVYAARRDLLWPELTAEAQASLTREQDQLRPLVKRRVRETKRAHAVLSPSPTLATSSMDVGKCEATLRAKFGEAHGEFARARSAGVLSALRTKYDWLWTALPAALAAKLESAFAAQMTALGGGMSLFDGGVS